MDYFQYVVIWFLLFSRTAFSRDKKLLQSPVTVDVDNNCPCLPVLQCRQEVKGDNSDSQYLGLIPACEDLDMIRCCGHRPLKKVIFPGQVIVEREKLNEEEQISDSSQKKLSYKELVSKKLHDVNSSEKVATRKLKASPRSIRDTEKVTLNTFTSIVNGSIEIKDSLKNESTNISISNSQAIDDSNENKNLVEDRNEEINFPFSTSSLPNDTDHFGTTPSEREADVETNPPYLTVTNTLTDMPLEFKESTTDFIRLQEESTTYSDYERVTDATFLNEVITENGINTTSDKIIGDTLEEEENSTVKQNIDGLNASSGNKTLSEIVGSTTLKKDGEFKAFAGPVDFGRVKKSRYFEVKEQIESQLNIVYPSVSEQQRNETNQDQNIEVLKVESNSDVRNKSFETFDDKPESSESFPHGKSNETNLSAVKSETSNITQKPKEKRVKIFKILDSDGEMSKKKLIYDSFQNNITTESSNAVNFSQVSNFSTNTNQSASNFRDKNSSESRADDNDGLETSESMRVELFALRPNLTTNRHHKEEGSNQSDVQSLQHKVLGTTGASSSKETVVPELVEKSKENASVNIKEPVMSRGKQKFKNMSDYLQGYTFSPLRKMKPKIELNSLRHTRTSTTENISNANLEKKIDANQVEASSLINESLSHNFSKKVDISSNAHEEKSSAISMNSDISSADDKDSSDSNQSNLSKTENAPSSYGKHLENFDGQKSVVMKISKGKSNFTQVGIISRLADKIGETVGKLKLNNDKDSAAESSSLGAIVVEYSGENGSKNNNFKPPTEFESGFVPIISSENKKIENFNDRFETTDRVNSESLEHADYTRSRGNIKGETFSKNEFTMSNMLEGEQPNANNQNAANSDLPFIGALNFQQKNGIPDRNHDSRNRSPNQSSKHSLFSVIQNMPGIIMEQFRNIVRTRSENISAPTNVSIISDKADPKLRRKSSQHSLRSRLRGRPQIERLEVQSNNINDEITSKKIINSSEDQGNDSRKGSEKFVENTTSFTSGESYLVPKTYRNRTRRPGYSKVNHTRGKSRRVHSRRNQMQPEEPTNQLEANFNLNSNFDEKNKQPSGLKVFDDDVDQSNPLAPKSRRQFQANQWKNHRVQGQMEPSKIDETSQDTTFGRLLEEKETPKPVSVKHVHYLTMKRRKVLQNLRRKPVNSAQAEAVKNTDDTGQETNQKLLKESDISTISKLPSELAIEMMVNQTTEIFEEVGVSTVPNEKSNGFSSYETDNPDQIVSSINNTAPSIDSNDQDKVVEIHSSPNGFISEVGSNSMSSEGTLNGNKFVIASNSAYTTVPPVTRNDNFVLEVPARSNDILRINEGDHPALHTMLNRAHFQKNQSYLPVISPEEHQDQFDLKENHANFHRFSSLTSSLNQIKSNAGSGIIPNQNNYFYSPSSPTDLHQPHSSKSESINSQSFFQPIQSAYQKEYGLGSEQETPNFQSSILRLRGANVGSSNEISRLVPLSQPSGILDSSELNNNLNAPARPILIPNQQALQNQQHAKSKINSEHSTMPLFSLGSNNFSKIGSLSSNFSPSRQTAQSQGILNTRLNSDYPSVPQNTNLKNSNQIQEIGARSKLFNRPHLLDSQKRFLSSQHSIEE